jgi:hypothetical protein
MLTRAVHYRNREGATEHSSRNRFSPASTSGNWNTVAEQAAGAWEFNAALKKMVSPRLWPQCSPSASLNPPWRLTPAFDSRP